MDGSGDHNGRRRRDRDGRRRRDRTAADGRPHEIISLPELISKSGSPRIGMGFIPILGPTWTIRVFKRGCAKPIIFIINLHTNVLGQRNCPDKMIRIRRTDASR